MAAALIALAGAGLVGCFAATLGMNKAERGSLAGRRMARPRRSAVVIDAVSRTF